MKERHLFATWQEEERHEIDQADKGRNKMKKVSSLERLWSYRGAYEQVGEGNIDKNDYISCAKEVGVVYNPACAEEPGNEHSKSHTQEIRS